MRTPERRYSDVRRETRPGEEPSELEEFGRAITLSLITLGITGLAAYVLYQLGL